MKDLLVLTVILCSLLLVSAQKTPQTPNPGATRGASDSAQLTVYDGPSFREETKCLPSERIKSDFWLTLHYNATIDHSSKTGKKGQLVDSTHEAHTKRPEPIMINMADEDPMLQWSKAMLGLCGGDKIFLVVPPELAYGDVGDGRRIPGGATLNLDIHIVTAHEDPAVHYKQIKRNPEKMFKEMDSDGDGKVTLEEMEIYLNVPENYPNRERFIQQHFELSDYNRDGTVSLEEFKMILENWQGIDEL